ncbi:MAG: co-chaperone GroES [Candidatus Omnitrophica bacterium]|nr:co-chaperone GroES [Candidatus Omnitrophota bacterium]
MALKALGDRIVVKAVEQQDRTKSGIVLPESAKEKPQEGRVASVGPGRLLDNGSAKSLEVKAGDRVLYGKYAGTEVRIDGEDYLILREDDVLAVVQA